MCTAESRQVPVGPGAVLASACLYAADPTVSRGCSDDVGASPARRASGAVHTTAHLSRRRVFGVLLEFIARIKKRKNLNRMYFISGRAEPGFVVGE